MRKALWLSLLVSIGCTETKDGATADSGFDSPTGTGTGATATATGTGTGTSAGVDADEDGYDEDEDCNDADPSINPGATEVCDGIDNNCNDETDEGVTFTLYTDADGDGAGDPDAPVEACDVGPGIVDNTDDCDDTRDDVFSGNPEVCDGIDNNCNDETDEGVTNTYYTDYDGDGVGDPDAPVEACELTTGIVDNSDDCDDTRGDVNPSATEIYDGIDNDCNDVIDGADMPEWHHAPTDGDIIGPEDWATYWPECGGYNQSPVDLDSAVFVQGTPPTITSSYKVSGLNVENDGHTIVYHYDPGSTLTLDGMVYQLAQFHFHASSEHTWDGYPETMEMHVVHVDDGGTADDPFDDSFVVISVPIDVSAYTSNLAFEQMDWDQIYTLGVGSSLVDPYVTLNMNQLLPANWQENGRPGVHYAGSLTTPPCFEAVHWLVSDYSVLLSNEQVTLFTDLYSANFRATQPLNGRELLHKP